MNINIKTTLILVSILFTLTISTIAQDDDGLQWSGYFENQVFFQYIPTTEELLILDYNKLRLDMAYEVTENITFNADIIFRTYHGATNLNMLDFIPEDYGMEIPDFMAPYLQVNLENDYFINDAYISIYMKGLSIRIGKQQLPWGSGYTWNPTDNFNVKNQLDPTYEKEGVNALKIEVPIGLDGNMAFIAYNRDGIDHPNYAFKIKKNIAGFDISTSYQYFKELNLDFETFEPVEQRRHIVGFDFTGQIFDIGFWGEGTYNWPDKDNFYDEEFAEYLIGGDYTFENGLYIMTEYLHRDRGIKDSKHYDINEFLRLLTGEITNLGTDYLSVGCSYPVSDFVTVQIFSIFNIQDNSWIAIPWISWDAAENLEVNFSGNIFLGDISSEYGEYPGGALVRIRLYF